MKDFKHTGNGPKNGHSFGAKHGFSHSGTSKQQVSGYSRSKPKAKFAEGGVVKYSPTSDGGSALTQRSKSVSQFDKEAGGKTPLRSGFAEGGKVESVGAAIRMVKELMKRGETAESASAKASRRYNVPLQPAKPTDPAKPLLAQGGRVPMSGAPMALGQGRVAAAPIGAPRPMMGGPAAQTGFGAFRRGPLVR